ncbi:MULTISPECIES: hypothetical protein [Bacillus]|uniref:hypothetical protein n=1 Tax=Bacillus TaxID=1386 RepID=UPI00077A911E|nr:hypothetical protein [Bacillus tropicus]KXY81174.1 hypothetical protein AT270_30785 [Bacillus cereus]MBG9939091.1 hypothetical protein [Bacillus tropicus]OTY50832.1 hypothetical protein BK748_24200 [Bacillus thuringiensis serovar graciosensis]
MKTKEFESLLYDYDIKNISLNNEALEYNTNNLYENLARIYDKNEFLLRDSVLFAHSEYVDMEAINQKYNEVYRILIELLLPIHTAMSNDRKSQLNKLIISLIKDIENKATEINYYELNFY